MDERVMADSSKTEFVMGTRTVPGMKSGGDVLFFIVPEATQSDEIAGDAEAGEALR